MRTFNLAAAIALTALATAPAFAGQDDTQTRTIRVTDLNLASADGQAALRYRIARAVEGVCGSYGTAHGPTAEDRITACRTDVTAGINRQVARLQSTAVQTAALDR